MHWCQSIWCDRMHWRIYNTTPHWPKCQVAIFFANKVIYLIEFSGALSIDTKIVSQLLTTLMGGSPRGFDLHLECTHCIVHWFWSILCGIYNSTVSVHSMLPNAPVNEHVQNIALAQVSFHL